MAMTKTDTLNYRGELFLIGANQTPFLNMAGGLSGGKRTSSFTFPVAQPWSLDSASQDTQSEDTSVSAGTPKTYSRAQDVNVCQIMKHDVAVSFKKQAAYGNVSGINTDGDQPVKSELDFQKEAGLMQMAVNSEYSFLRGSYVAESATSTNTKTRGIIEACVTNAVAGGSAALSKAMIDTLLRTMAGNGSLFQETVVFVNAFQKQAISDIYGYAPQDRNVGGVNIQVIETDFARLGVVYAPQMPTDTLLIADMAFVAPVFNPVSFNGEQFVTDEQAGADVLWVPTAITAASKGGFYYTHIGLDHGPEEYHGKITGLATS